MKIEIPYKISETEKEIYCFDVSFGNVDYYGIFYSRRNDANDTWGDEWNKPKNFTKEKEKLKKYIEEFEEMTPDEYLIYDDKYNKLKDRINPVCNKTKEGEPYYSGMTFGCETNKPEIKMGKEKIKEEIRKEVNKLKFNF